MSRQKKKGFTLVELVVVLVIMTVILGIAISSVLHYMKMAEFRKNEENAKTVYLAAESKLTYYRSSGQWEDFKKEVMSQGKEAPFTDSKRKGKIYGITLDKEHDGASASNNAVLGLLDGYTYDKSMLDAMMSAEILGVLSSSQNKDGELDATTSTSILRLAKVAESLKEQQTIYACIQAVPYYQRGSQSTNEYRSSEKVPSNSSNTLYGDDSTENNIKVAYFRQLSNIRYEEEDTKKEITLTNRNMDWSAVGTGLYTFALQEEGEGQAIRRPVWYRVHGKLAKSQLQFSGEELRALLMGSMDERKKKSSLPDEMWTLGWRSVTAAVRGSIFFGSSIRWQRPSAC